MQSYAAAGGGGGKKDDYLPRQPATNIRGDDRLASASQKSGGKN
jgi:hypothetical protein